MKKLIVVLILATALAGCVPITIGNPELGNGIVTTAALKPGQDVAVQKSKNSSKMFEFNGYSNKVGEHWVISFSNSANSAVNDYFLVKEGDIVEYEDVKFKIEKLNPFKNEITISTAN